MQRESGQEPTERRPELPETKIMSVGPRLQSCLPVYPGSTLVGSCWNRPSAPPFCRSPCISSCSRMPANKLNRSRQNNRTELRSLSSVGFLKLHISNPHGRQRLGRQEL